MKKMLSAWIRSFAWGCVAGSVLILMLSISARSAEFHQLYRGARAQAMGNAYVGLADDEQAIFLNPAGLAGVKKYTFHYLVGDFSASADLIRSFSEGADAFSDPSADSLNNLLGKNVSGRAQMSSMLMMPNLGIGLIIDGQASFRGKNRALPNVTLGYQTTNGIQVAYGATLGKAFKQKAEFRVGLAAKMLFRRGGYTPLPLLTLLTFSKDTLSQITGNYSRGIGLDLGSQYVHRPNKRLTLSAGLAYTDVGDTSFSNEADPITGLMTLGFAAQYELRGATKFTVAYDFRNIQDGGDWRKKQHVGVELALPILSLYGGINQVYFSYGASVDLWLLRVTGLTYVEELGEYVHQDPERRWTLKLALKFDL